MLDRMRQAMLDALRRRRDGAGRCSICRRDMSPVEVAESKASGWPLPLCSDECRAASENLSTW